MVLLRHSCPRLSLMKQCVGQYKTLRSFIFTVSEVKNQTIIENPELEGIHRDHWVHFKDQHRTTKNETKYLRALPNPFLVSGRIDIVVLMIWKSVFPKAEEQFEEEVKASSILLASSPPFSELSEIIQCCKALVFLMIYLLSAKQLSTVIKKIILVFSSQERKIFFYCMECYTHLKSFFFFFSFLFIILNTEANIRRNQM